LAAPFAPSRALRLRSGQAPPARAGGPDWRSHAFTLRRTRKPHPVGFPAGTEPHARAFVAGRPEAAINPATEREISVSVRLGRTTVTPSRSGRCSVSSSSSCIPPPKTVRQRRNVSARAPSRVKLSRYKQAKLNSQNLLNITIQARSVNRERKVESAVVNWIQEGGPWIRPSTPVIEQIPSCARDFGRRLTPPEDPRCARDFACGLPLANGSSCRKSHQLLH